MLSRIGTMSHSDLKRQMPYAGAISFAGIGFVSRRLLVGTAVILGDLVLLGVLLYYGGVFDL
jgi:hypothetical protein